MHLTAPGQDLDLTRSMPYFETLLQQALLLPADAKDQEALRRRGRPVQLCLAHLWMGLIVSVLLGMNSYQDLWRRLCSQTIGSFSPLALTEDAIVKRLRQAGTDPLQHLFFRLATVLAERLRPVTACTLAPIAREIVALDESTWDAVQRHLPHLRALPDGHSGLLPGKLAGRFNLRSQQWGARAIA